MGARNNYSPGQADRRPIVETTTARAQWPARIAQKTAVVSQGQRYGSGRERVLCYRLGRPGQGRAWDGWCAFFSRVFARSKDRASWFWSVLPLVVLSYFPAFLKALKVSSEDGLVQVPQSIALIETF